MYGYFLDASVLLSQGHLHSDRLTKAFQGQDSKKMQSIYTGYESLLLPAVLRSHLFYRLIFV